MPPPCAACAAPAAPLACARCKCAFYCSAACQRAAWGAHKTLCVAGAADGLPALGKWDKPQRCSTCGSEGAWGSCDGCECAAYCDEQCQRAAWGAHRDACCAAAAAPFSKDAGDQSRCSLCDCETPVYRKLCGRCRTESYCGEACARAHWTAAGGHRGACTAAGAALFSFERARAEAGSAYAMFRVGLLHEGGIGAATDAAAAVDWYTRAAKAGLANTSRALAEATVIKDAYEQSRCSHCSCETPFFRMLCGRCRTVAYCSKVCARAHWTAGGHRGACTAAGEALFSITTYRHANGGITDAAYLLGLYYRYGVGVAANEGQAFNTFFNAADKGHVGAQLDLGFDYSKGIGPTDAATAVMWFTRAADAGDADAMTALAACYAEGAGVAINIAESAALLARAAAAGHAVAQYTLGLNCLHGIRGVARDVAAARGWLACAAAGGVAQAAAELAALDAAAPP